MASNQPTVLIAAGGTGGHIFPGLATADALRQIRPDLAVEFVGTAERMEATLVPEAGYRLHTVEAMALPRKTDPRIVKLPFVLGRSVSAVRALIKERNVIAACGFGGYTSVSLGLGAKSMGVPLVIHEQNAVPGVTNKLLAPFTARVAGTFTATMDAMGQPQSGAIGNPVRTSFAEALATQGYADRAAILGAFGLAPDRQTIVVFGGSQGAKAVNTAIVHAGAQFTNPSTVQVLHGTGARSFDEVMAMWAELAPPGLHYHVTPFIDNMAEALQVADVVVCRSGASTLAELTVLGLPAILVPYPYATGDHQHANAQAMTQANAARLIADADLSGPVLADTIEAVLDPHTNAQMRAASAGLGRPRAAHDLANMILEVAR